MSTKEKFLQLTELYRQGKTLEAGEKLAKILALSPRDQNFLHLAGLVAEANKELSKAASYFRRALTIHPDWPEAALNLARILWRNNDKQTPLLLCQDLIQRHPDLPEAYEYLAKYNHMLGHLPAAAQAYAMALKIMPTNNKYWGEYLLLLRHMCEWQPPSPSPPQGLILTPQATLVLTDDPAKQHIAAEAYAKQNFPASSIYSHRHNLAPSFQPTTNKRIRIGYLSSDFHAHATSYLMADLFTLHNRHEFEIFTYSYGIDDKSAIRTQIIQNSEHFIELGALKATEAAARIRQDNLDLLIDLKGYTKGGRPEILAQRPAPVQAHWLGFPGTLGASFIDYFIADTITLPPEHEPYFTEKILRLPNSYQINTNIRKTAIPESRHKYGLPENGPVIACFNQSYKFTEAHFQAMCTIMRQVPQACLWLLASNIYAEKNLKQTAAQNGIDPARLVFAPHTDQAEHLARYAHVTLALDTFPIGGHTTTGDALACGVPVITRIGQSFISRVAASLLSAAGLPQLITQTEADYIAVATTLLQYPEQIAELKHHLTRAPTKPALFALPQFVKDLENLYRKLLCKN